MQKWTFGCTWNYYLKKSERCFSARYFFERFLRCRCLDDVRLNSGHIHKIIFKTNKVDCTLFQTIMHPSIEVETTSGELLGEETCPLPFSLSAEGVGQLDMHVTAAECPQKLPINSPVFEDIACIKDLSLQ